MCHSCDTPLCVNPSHLWLGTVADNNADMRSKGREARGERHGSAKLTAWDIAEIRNQVEKGVDNRTIGRQFGIAPQTVGKIAARKRWAHVS